MHLQVLLLARSPFGPSLLCNALPGCAIAADAELHFGTCALAHARCTMQHVCTVSHEHVGLLHVYLHCICSQAGLLYGAKMHPIRGHS